MGNIKIQDAHLLHDGQRSDPPGLQFWVTVDGLADPKEIIQAVSARMGLVQKALASLKSHGSPCVGEAHKRWCDTCDKREAIELLQRALETGK